MDDFSWILLGGLLVLGLPAMAVAGFFMALGLKGRVRLLELRIDTLQGELASLRAGPPAREPQTPTIGPEEQPAAERQADDAETAAAAAAPEEPAVEMPPSVTPPRGEAEPPRRAARLEEALGARWAVWIGGIALALGGMFLVRYSLEAGLIGPEVRIALGFLFAVVLIALGEWLRRRRPVPGDAPERSAYIPGVVTAAGTASLFASVYAAHGLYGFIGSTAAFLALGVVGLATMAMAGLHGPWLAALGLIGAYATPFLVERSEPKPWPLVIYLLVVTAASFGLARLRLWRWLALAATAAAVGWGALIVTMGAPWTEGAASAYVLALASLALVVLVLGPHRGRPYDGFDGPALLAIAGAAALALLLAAETGVSSQGLAVALVVAGATLGVALAVEAVAPGAAIAALLGLGLLLVWPIDAQIAAEPVTALPGPIASAATVPAALGLYIGVAAALGLALLAATALRLLAGGLALRPGVALALAGTAGPVLILACAYVRTTAFAASPPFAAVALALGAAHAAIAQRLLRQGSAAADAGASLHAAGGWAALAVGLTTILEGSPLTLAFALASLGTAFVAARRPLPALRWCAAALALLVLARSGGAWTIVGAGFETVPTFVDILYRYAGPALAIGLAGHLLRRDAPDTPAALLDGAAILLGALAATLAVRLWIVGAEDALTRPFGLIEAGIDATILFAAAIGFARGARTTSSVVHRAAAPVAAFTALVTSVLGPLLFLNPLAGGESVEGGTVLNSLLLGYLAPALGALAAGLQWRRIEESGDSFLQPFARPLATACGAVALLLAFAYVTFETRVAVSGPDMSYAVVSDGESYAYSAVWLLFGIALLACGLALASRNLRLASAFVILLTVAKVFLVDMGDLEGAWRALSFIGLGLALIGIGLVYQRVLRRAGSSA